MSANPIPIPNSVLATEPTSSILHLLLNLYEYDQSLYLLFLFLAWVIVAFIFSLVSTLLSKSYRSFSNKNNIIEQRGDWLIECCSILHTFFTLFLAYSNYRYGSGTEYENVDLCTSNLTWRSAGLYVSVSYYIFHNVAMIFHWCKYDEPLIYHHIFTIISIIIAVRCSFVTWHLATLLWTEASTVFLNLRYFLSIFNVSDDDNKNATNTNDEKKTATKKKAMTTVQNVNGLMFAFTFFLCRILFIPWMFYRYAIDFEFCWTSTNGDGIDISGVGGSRDDVPVIVRSFAAVNFPILWVLNVFWFQKMLRFIGRALGGGGRGKGEDKKEKTKTKLEIERKKEK